MGEGKRSSASLRGFAVFGSALLLAGVLAARAHLPEWAPVSYSGVDSLKSASEQLARVEARLTFPKIATRTRSSGGRLVERVFRTQGLEAPAMLRLLGIPVGPVIEGTLEMPGSPSGPVTLALDPEGRIVRLDWLPGGQTIEFTAPDEKTRAARRATASRLVELLVRPGEELLEEREFVTGNTSVAVRAIRGNAGRPAEGVVRVVVPNALVSLSREPADPEGGAALSPGRGLTGQLAKAVPGILLAFGTAILFAILLFRRRISFRAGLFLAVGIVVSVLIGGLSGEPASAGVVTGLVVLLTYLVMGAFTVILWTVAESLLRDAVPNFTTSLDAFSYGQLLPRGGRALLSGLAGGAAFLGVSLLVPALAARFAPHLGPTGLTFQLPLFEGQRSPFFEGVYDSASFVLLFALLRFRLDRAAWLLTIGLWGLWISTGLPVHAALALPLGLAMAAILGFVFRSHGLAALLVAATAAPLFRDLLAAFVHPRGNLGPGAVAGLTLVAIAVFGFVGMSRPDREDDVKVEAPEYVRRLESERRVQYEMGLLSRMQLSLLPEKPPEIPGYEISVKTMLATEAGGDLYDFLVDTSGGLWIAAGDVAGHGYSCGIQQAMVKASLASLVKAGRGPGEILGEVDRVLRTLGPQRTFTSLALLCLDPATGRGRIANAGHPYPILLHEGRSTELSVSGLPLGQGPKRTYQELEVELPRGASLLIASDGLFEGPNGFDEPWGYERPRAVLEGIGLFRRPAGAIIEALLADFRLHTGDGPPADDTTLVVLKRAS